MSDYLNSLFKTLVDFQRDGTLCDVIITAQNGVVHAHSSVLGASNLDLQNNLADQSLSSAARKGRILYNINLSTCSVSSIITVVQSIYMRNENNILSDQDCRKVMALMGLEVPLHATRSAGKMIKNASSASLSESLLNMQRSGVLCDVMIHTGNGSVQAHSALLAASNEKLRNMFEQQALEYDNISKNQNKFQYKIELPDWSLPVVIDNLQSLYTGQVKEFTSDSDRKLSSDLAKLGLGILGLEYEDTGSMIVGMKSRTGNERSRNVSPSSSQNVDRNRQPVLALSSERLGNGETLPEVVRTTYQVKRDDRHASPLLVHQPFKDTSSGVSTHIQHTTQSPNVQKSIRHGSARNINTRPQSVTVIDFQAIKAAGSLSKIIKVSGHQQSVDSSYGSLPQTKQNPAFSMKNSAQPSVVHRASLPGRTNYPVLSDLPSQPDTNKVSILKFVVPQAQHDVPIEDLGMDVQVTTSRRTIGSEPSGMTHIGRMNSDKKQNRFLDSAGAYNVTARNAGYAALSSHDDSYKANTRAMSNLSDFDTADNAAPLRSLLQVKSEETVVCEEMAIDDCSLNMAEGLRQDDESESRRSCRKRKTTIPVKKVITSDTVTSCSSDAVPMVSDIKEMNQDPSTDDNTQSQLTSKDSGDKTYIFEQDGVLTIVLPSISAMDVEHEQMNTKESDVRNYKAVHPSGDSNLKFDPAGNQQDTQPQEVQISEGDTDSNVFLMVNPDGTLQQSQSGLDATDMNNSLDIINAILVKHDVTQVDGYSLANNGVQNETDEVQLLEKLMENVKEELEVTDDQMENLENSENGESRCTLCSKLFKHQTSVKVHMMACHRCAHCLQEFAQTADLRKHIRVHYCEEQGEELSSQETSNAKRPADEITDGALTNICKLCPKRFDDEVMLENHVNKCHRCLQCLQEFKQSSNLRKHVLVHHRSKQSHVCRICGKGFAFRSGLKEHLAVHEESADADMPNPIECRECDKKFARISGLRRHAKVEHAKVREYECPHCEKRYAYRCTLNNHLATHSTLRPYTCETCGLSFKQSANLLKHSRMQHKICVKCDSQPCACVPNPEYVCKTCGKACNGRSQLVVHERVHSGEKPEICNLCGKAFQHKSNLIKHYLKHEGIKPFVCTYCSRGFYNSHSLESHVRIHTGESPYQCETCGKRFCTKNGLQVHTLLHSDERPYVCGACGKAFAQLGNLNKHLAMHTGTKPFACSSCDMAFVDTSALRRHEVLHTRERNFVCQICGRTFMHLSSLREHKRLHEDATPYTCKICGRTFRQKTGYSRHVKIHHSSTDSEDIVLNPGEYIVYLTE